MRLASRAAVSGTTLLNRLQGFISKYPFIGHVRGKGLLTALELVADRDSWAPLPAAWEAHERIVSLGLERGLILYARRTMAGFWAIMCSSLRR